MQLLAMTAILLALASGPPEFGAQGQNTTDRAVQLYRDGESEQARQLLEKAVAEHPNDGRAWTFLGLARIDTKNYDGAVGALNRAVELNPKSARAHYGLGLAYGYQNKLEAAIDSLQRATTLDPKDAYAHYHLGLAYNQKRDTDRTLLHLDRFLTLAPEAPEAPRVRELLKRLRS